MSGTHGVFQHRSGYFYTILEEDFCEVYKAPGVNEVCRAYITSILENLTNKQFEATGKDEDIWVYMSLPEMERRMRHACSQRTIHKELQGMVKEGFLMKRRATGKATMEYKLNLKKLRKALQALPDIQSCKSATYNLANLQHQSGKSARLTLQNYKNDLADLQPRLHREVTEEYTEITQEVASQNFDATPLVPSENKNVSHFGHNAWNCEAWCNARNATCADYQAYIDSGQREETPTEPRTPIVTIGATDGNITTGTDIRSRRATSYTPGSDSDDALQDVRAAAGHPVGTTQTEQHPIAIASTPGEAVDPPIAAKTRQSKNDGATTVTASEPRPSGKRKKVTQGPPELSPEVTRILDDWDSLHKKPVPRIEANITAAQLLVAAQTNREEMKGCRDWLPTTDRPGKPWYRKIGVHLPDIAAKLEQYRSLQDMSEPVPVVDTGPGSVMQAQWEAAVQALPRVNDGERRSDFDAWVGNGPEERKRWRQKSAEMKAAGYSPDL